VAIPPVYQSSLAITIAACLQPECMSSRYLVLRRGQPRNCFSPREDSSYQTHALAVCELHCVLNAHNRERIRELTMDNLGANRHSKYIFPASSYTLQLPGEHRAAASNRLMLSRWSNVRHPFVQYITQALIRKRTFPTSYNLILRYEITVPLPESLTIHESMS
jgi:hypothetical protein